MKQIANYLIKHEIGRGGTSTVYLATDPTTGNDVAIKLLSQLLSGNSDARQRFEQEVAMLRELAHPAIVPVLDFGEWNGQLYVVMPFYKGGSVRSRLHDGPLSLEETNQILSRVASALDVAHAKHIIHRDVKPHNILCDGHGNAFLSDFGVARFIDPAGQEQTLTLVGTPEFIAPEQASQAALSPQTDIYQLGVTAFYMLTGEKPFEGAALEVLNMHLVADVPSAFEKNGTLPAGIDLTLKRAMAKDPKARYFTATAFIDELLTLADTPTSTQVLSNDELASLSIASVVAPASAASSNQGGGGDVYTQPAQRSGGRKPIRWVVAGVVGAVILAIGLLFTPIVDIGGGGGNGNGGPGNGGGRGAAQDGNGIAQIDLGQTLEEVDIVPDPIEETLATVANEAADTIDQIEESITDIVENTGIELEAAQADTDTNANDGGNNGNGNGNGNNGPGNGPGGGNGNGNGGPGGGNGNGNGGPGGGNGNGNGGPGGGNGNGNGGPGGGNGNGNNGRGGGNGNGGGGN